MTDERSAEPDTDLRAVAATLPPEEKAAAWMVAYANLHRPVALRLLSWAPSLVLLVVLLLNGPVIVSVLTAVLACFAVEAFWSAYHTRQYRSLLPVLTDFAGFPDSVTRERVETMILILNASHPTFRALVDPSPAQVRKVIAKEALRLFIVADAEGCGTGHSPICRHRRDNDSWMQWIDEAMNTEEADTPVAFRDATEQVQVAFADPQPVLTVEGIRAEMDPADRDAKP